MSVSILNRFETIPNDFDCVSEDFGLWENAHEKNNMFSNLLYAFSVARKTRRRIQYSFWIVCFRPDLHTSNFLQCLLTIRFLRNPLISKSIYYLNRLFAFSFCVKNAMPNQTRYFLILVSLVIYIFCYWYILRLISFVVGIFWYCYLLLLVSFAIHIFCYWHLMRLVSFVIGFLWLESFAINIFCNWYLLLWLFFNIGIFCYLFFLWLLSFAIAIFCYCYLLLLVSVPIGIFCDGYVLLLDNFLKITGKQKDEQYKTGF